jgi:predicted transcriptional regulator
MHTTLNGLGSVAEENAGSSEAASEYTPAVTVRKSLGSREHLISLIDGKPYKSLRRHLSTHGLTPEQYRERYKLKPDYPMVAPDYSEARRAMAHKIGLGARGRKAQGAAPAAPASEAASKPQRAPRKNAGGGAQTGAAKPKRGPRKAAAAPE